MYPNSNYPQRSYSNNGGYQQRSYENGGGYPQRSYGNRPQAAPKKHSGCKYRSSAKNGKPCMTGWNYSKRYGIISIIASPNTNKLKTKSSRLENWYVKVTINKEVKWMHGFFNTDNKKVIIQELGFVMNPNASNGGYCGKYFKTH
jgi:hypothetical protein